MAEKQTAKRNRREEILQSLALMLESSDGSQRITTAKLAASVGVSEAALYRHFPSKTRMFDSLIEFIEDSLITRINLILKDEKDTTARLRLIVLLLLGFGERNPGLTRILTGHALMFEQDRLQGRINQLFERIEAQLRQVLREKRMREGEGYTTDETLLASQILAFCEGMLSRFVRSEFKYRPTDDFDARWPLIAAQLQGGGDGKPIPNPLLGLDSTAAGKPIPNPLLGLDSTAAGKPIPNPLLGLDST